VTKFEATQFGDRVRILIVKSFEATGAVAKKGSSFKTDPPKTNLAWLNWGRFHQTFLPSEKLLAHCVWQKFAAQFHQQISKA
jgi:hypothetical protein